MVEGPTILVVEDEQEIRRFLRASLENQSYRIVEAQTARDGLKRAAEDHPDLVLLDVVLPKKNGFQVCRQLKTTVETSGAKVILVSSKNQPSDRFWGMKQGADEYLTKPFEAQDLLATVQRSL